jgi:L-seryl-tRNA(Ser) seleniumtransferase
LTGEGRGEGDAGRILVFDDLGSGALFDNALWRDAGEPTVRASLKAGADLVSFSGDKLLGGPQAGIILGRRAPIERLRRHPMARALRIDKLTIAALQATLALYLDSEQALREIPTLRLLHASSDELMRRAETLRGLLSAALPGEDFSARAAESFAGGGALPAWPLPTAVVAWRIRGSRGFSSDAVARALRIGTPPAVARIEDDAILFDVRALDEAELPELAAAVRAAHRV